MKPSHTLVFALLLATAVGSLLLALGSGSLAVTWRELAAILGGGGDPLQARVVLELRLPRALSGFVVGGLLALAGALLQVLLRNPLADPYVLGVSGGAGVGALLSILLGAAAWTVSAAAFVGALVSILLVFGLSHGAGGWTPTRLLLTGVVLAAGWGAAISFMLAISPDTGLRGMLFWLMGDLSDADMPGVSALLLALGLVAALRYARDLNLLARGGRQAAVLGVDTDRLRYLLYLLASLLTASAVTLAGTVGFVGLVVPHMLRLVVGGDHRRLLPASVLAGGGLLTLADTFARTLLAPQQLPVGVVTAMLGVPMFLYLLNRSQRSANRTST